MFMFIVLSIPLLMVIKEQKSKVNVDFIVDTVQLTEDDYESD